MAPRLATRPVRENDFSNVGKIGRRTGVTLPQGRIDVNGMEEITGIFSSPRKPSPLRQSTAIIESVEGRVSITPKRTTSVRKSIPLPRSASPRKSGISGTAKRSKTVDVLGQNKEQVSSTTDQDVIKTQLNRTPALLASAAKRFSPAKTPSKSSPKSRQSTARRIRQGKAAPDTTADDSIVTEHDPMDLAVQVEERSNPVETSAAVNEYVLPAIADDDDNVMVVPSPGDDYDEPPLPPVVDDEEADQTFEPEKRSKSKPKEPTIANSRRKRKSDALDQETEAEVEAVSSPAAKRAKRISDQATQSQQKESSSKSKPNPNPNPAPEPPLVKRKGRPPLKDKATNLKMSATQEKQLDKLIERVKPRPGQKKSLHILRRETPAEDGVSHTRSGRMVVKPLAYWRNEKCVYGGSPGGASLQDGARFPLNSIKEIIRTQSGEGLAKSSKKSKRGKSRSKDKTKGKGKNVLPARSAEEGGNEDIEISESESDEDEADADAEPWETERGIFRGPVAVWDHQEQAPVDDEEEEIEIAYVKESIVMREVKDSTFRFAKMLSLKFFGSGIVDLPPGGVKKAKYSRRMHMSFFVAEGRVTATVGPLGGPENRFSIGKGGWWQVPRGNQYAIENELSKPARVFFSQACEPVPPGEEG